MLEPDALPALSVRLLGQHLAARFTYYVELEPEGGSGMVMAGFGAGPAARRGASLPIDTFGCETALQAGRTVVVTDAAADIRLGSAVKARCREWRSGAHVLAPVLHGGRLLAVLGVHSDRPRGWTDRDVHLVEITARGTAAALAHARRPRNEARQGIRPPHEAQDGPDGLPTASHQALERRVRERTVELEEQTARLRNLAWQLTTAEQRERKRLAAVLHDHLQQLLFAAMMQLDHARGHLEERGPASAALAAAAERVGEAIGAARDLTRRLRPPALYEAGLGAALEWLSSQMDELHDLRVTVALTGGRPRLDDDVSALLFECVRELLFNVVKHAGTAAAHVSLITGEGRLRLEVSDEGSGFPVEELGADPDRATFGLLSIRERMAALGGAMDIESVPGEGTRVRLAFKWDGDEVEPHDEPRRSWAEDEEAVRPAGPRREPDRKVRVLVVDDHAIVRRGLVEIVQRESRLEVVGEAADGLEALKQVHALRPDVVLLDVNMPHLNGFQATREIRHHWPEVAVIGLSVQGDHGTATSMLSAGVAAFIPKSGHSDHLVETIVELGTTERRHARAAEARASERPGSPA